MEKAWFYEKLFFNVAMTVMLPEDFQEFEVIYVFLATFGWMDFWMQPSPVP